MINQNEYEEIQKLELKNEIIETKNIIVKIHFWIKFFAIIQIISTTLYLIITIIASTQ